MPFCDLRDFLHALEKEGELARITQPVELEYEVSAVCRESLQRHGLEHNKALLFEKAGNSSVPLVANLLTSRRRLAMALETEVSRLHQRFIEASGKPRQPELTAEAPCQEVVMTGEQVDLFRFPIPRWNELDPAPYITAPCHISKDPETGIRNVAVYRAMVHDHNHLGVLAAPYRHLALHHGRAQERGLSFPVAICLGPDPSVYIAAQVPLPFGQDELALAGALRGEAVPVVKCQTIDLEVPATSEIILEGEIVPGLLKEEGPFGEFTGYYGGGRALRPVIEIKAITHRRQPIYHAAYQGRPPNDTSVTFLVSNEAEIMRNVSLPGLHSIYLKEAGMSLVAVASIRKLYEGYSKVMATAILSTEAGRLIKTIVMVDEEIEPSNNSLVDWALATRFQPDRDAVIFEGFPGITLDPSLPAEERVKETNRTSKLILDATRPLGVDFPSEAKPPQEVMDQVIRRWKDYGVE